MIQFYKFEIRSVPEQTPFTVFAPNFEELQKREDYIAWFNENKPRCIQIKETQYWDRTEFENRYATQAEVDNYINAGTYEQHQATVPSTIYKHFGNKDILEPLQQKLKAEYEGYVLRWKESFNTDRTAFYEQLREICTVRTVYMNLSEAKDYYPTEYMKNLLEMNEPLKVLSDAYIKYIGWNIEPSVCDILRRAKKDTFTDGENSLNPKAMPEQSLGDRIEILQSAAKTEYVGFEKEWQGMGFEDTLSHAVRIFSIRQVYEQIMNNIGQYSNEDIYAWGLLNSPIAYDLDRVVGERDIRILTMDELNDTLPEIFPNVQTEPDIWGLWKRRYKPEFALKEGLESTYRDFAILNSDGYGSAIIRYMNRWANMMEAEISNGKSVSQAAELTQHIANKDSITGFMYNCAVQGLVKFWKQGEELRQWHNGSYNYNGDGVVNSCVVSIPNNDNQGENNDGADEAPVMEM